MITRIRAILSGRSRVTAGSHPSDDNGWWGTLGKGANKARVTETNADTISTVWACVTGISADVAKLPLHLYRRNGEGDGAAGRERAKSHPAYRIIRRPNDEMTAFSFWETILRHGLSWGNGYAEIERDGAGSPVNLWPIHPSRCKLMRDRRTRRLFYRVTSEGGPPVDLPAEDVFHLHGISEDGLIGKSPVRCAMESLSGAAAAEKFGKNYFENDATPGVMLSHPQRLSDTARRNLRESWKEMYGGDKVGSVAVLEEGLKAERLSFPPKESQFLETRQFHVSEVCRWFRYPPHKAGDLSRATFSNIEHQDLAYLGETLMPWMVRVEQEAARKLLFENEQEEYYYEYLAEAALRMDFKTRMEGYSLAKNNGWMSADEIRAKENMNPMPAGEGKIFTVSSAMTTPAMLLKEAENPEPEPTEPPAPPAPTPEPEDDADDGAERARVVRAIAAANTANFEAAFRSLLRIESDKLRRSAKGGLAAAVAWADGFYPSHLDYVRGVLFPAVEGVARSVAAAVGADEPDVAALVKLLATRHVEASHHAVRTAVQVEQLLKQWEGGRGERDAKDAGDVLAGEIIRALGALVTE